MRTKTRTVRTTWYNAKIELNLYLKAEKEEQLNTS